MLVYDCLGGFLFCFLKLCICRYTQISSSKMKLFVKIMFVVLCSCNHYIHCGSTFIVVKLSGGMILNLV